MISLYVGGVRYALDASAMSAIRHRSYFGKSAIEEIIGTKDGAIPMAVLIRATYMMIVGEKPDYKKYAYSARADKGFVKAAQEAILFLIRTDPKSKTTGKPKADSFDEFEFLAAFGRSGLPECLLYELPIMHIAAVMNHMVKPEPERRMLQDKEISAMYPRRARNGNK